AMQHAVAMHVVELEALHLGAVDECSIGRGQLLRSAPDRGRTGGVEAGEGPLQDPGPFERGAMNPAAERVEDQKLGPLAHRGGNLLTAELRDEAGDPAGVEVVAAGVLRHVDPARNARLQREIPSASGENLDMPDSPVYSCARGAGREIIITAPG